MNLISIRFRITLLFGLLLIPFAVDASPQIKQIFPSHKFLLGQSRFWIIEIQHPLWESYTLAVNKINGAEITIAEKTSRIESEEVISVYRLKIIPGSLDIPETPSILISDGKGQNTVLNGKPIVVQSISGDSLALKEALPLMGQKSSIYGSRFIYGIVLGIPILALSFLVWRRKWASKPKQILKRQMNRVLKEIALSPNKYPAALEKIFRSEFFWGDSGDARTASELRDAAGADPHLKQLAETLLYLEEYRYSDQTAFTGDDRIKQSIFTGLELLKKRRPFLGMVR